MKLETLTQQTMRHRNRVRKPIEKWYIPNVVAYYQFMKYLLEERHHITCVITDPMNGCAEDFAEDFNRKHRGDEYIIYHYEETLPKWQMKIADFFLKRIEARLDRQYNELPWNQQLN